MFTTFGFGWLLFLGSTSGSPSSPFYSDPLRPPPPETCSHSKIPFYQLSSHLQRLRKSIEKEERELEALAPLQLGVQFDDFGYHSDFIPAVEEVPDEPLWTLDLIPGSFPTLALVLVPAFDQRLPNLRGYAFPKRFRIRSVDSEDDPGKILVDWTSRDFPDPGNRPVYFSFPQDEAPEDRLRLEVFAGHEQNGEEFFALGRIHPIRQGEQQKAGVEDVSSSFDSPPFWSSEALVSSRQSLGMPLSAEKSESKDLVLKLPAETLEGTLVFRIELDEPQILGWVNLYPGKNPEGVNLPGYGFPKHLRLYRVEQDDKPNERARRFPLGEPVNWEQPSDQMIRIPGGGSPIKALEISCNDFPSYQGQAVFSLGEIEIVRSGQNYSRGRKITTRNFSLPDETDLDLLVDGKVGGHSILPLPEWFQQLAKGKAHEARLVSLNAELAVATARWKTLQERALLTFGFFLLLAAAAVVVIIRRSRTQARLSLRKQIHSDLHDDVGSSLGSISLIAEQLQQAKLDEEVREDLGDLALIAREAWASLRDIVWVIDEDSIRLPALIDQLSERAKRVLAGTTVSVETPEACPNSKVSLPFKRHFIMFFKEVLHNCARHSHATEVHLKFRIIDEALQVSVRDNGCGFNPEMASGGLGLENIRNRAQEMAGQLTLNSSLGEGTQVVLEVPLKALLNQSDHSYKTSN
ncbi:sensor histidine kinase [Roseibacillus persicicus]|uniref:sensor histidine kinase n=1 Tax=Roseibacillus persicicus TaxID=454148 RepID=UPI0016794C52|nr:ATP-binding protein [Roseibacillus persicicus]